MTPESKVKQKVKTLLDRYKPRCWYFLPSARVYGQTGIPDFIGCFCGYMFAIETKAGHNRPTAMQMKQLADIAASGGGWMVVRENTVYKVADWLRTVYYYETIGLL